MTLTSQQVANIAQLARLELKPEEATAYAASLSNISSGNSRELYQRNAPAVEAGLYLVPKVIE
jgi:Asp-tRNA(Asn)/Glu-tRNA(Gln) amidotransferase C subunit